MTNAVLYPNCKQLETDDSRHVLSWTMFFNSSQIGLYTMGIFVLLELENLSCLYLFIYWIDSRISQAVA